MSIAAIPTKKSANSLSYKENSKRILRNKKLPPVDFNEENLLVEISVNVDHFKILIKKEDDISWVEQNQIHKILNVAFYKISYQFVNKTYAYIPPIERVLGYKNKNLVAHIAIGEDILKLEYSELKVGTLGLLASIINKKGLATSVLSHALEHLKSHNVKLAIARTCNEVFMKYVLPKFGSTVKLLNVRIYGKNHTSKERTTTLLFNIAMKNDEFEKITTEIIKMNGIYINGEPP